jgi:hypothetical protein
MRSREGCRKQAGPGAPAILRSRGPKDPLFYPSAELGQSDTGYDWSTFRHSGYSCVINKIIFRALVLLYNRQLVTPMYGAILESFPSYRHCVVRNGSTLMIAEGLNLLYFSTIALIVAFLTARIASKKDRAIFKRQHFPTLKKCPNCAEQLPLPTLVCDACDYNFLSRIVGHRHKLLPSPSEPLAFTRVSESRVLPSHIGE